METFFTEIPENWAARITIDNKKIEIVYPHRKNDPEVLTIPDDLDIRINPGNIEKWWRAGGDHVVGMVIHTIINHLKEVCSGKSHKDCIIDYKSWDMSKKCWARVFVRPQ